MFTDGRTLDKQRLEAAVCIVGAGAAGITLALQFAGTGTKVIVLESGDFEPDAQTMDLNAGEETGLGYSIESSRLRYFGGTTNHWEGQCAPFRESEMAEREWIRDSAWPINRDTLNPFYVRAQETLGIKGAFEQNFPKVESKLGQSEELNLLRKMYAQTKRFGSAYRGKLKSQDNINVILRANLTAIERNESGSEITALNVITLEGQHFTVSARYYVLACGGIENARLLLHTRLDNQRDLVGRFFMDHTRCIRSSVFYSFKPEHTRALFQSDGRVHLSIQPSTEVIKRYRIGSASINIWPLQPPPSSVPNIVRYMQKIVQHTDMPIQAFEVVLVLEQLPNPDSRIILSDTHRDSLGMPRAHLHWSFLEQDYETARAVQGMITRYLSMPAEGVLHIEDWFRREKAWAGKLNYGCHHMGTTRMHESETQGVVDPQCRLHGVSNFYVAGSSVFPTGGNVNPTFTIIALALRLADHLKQKLA